MINRTKRATTASPRLLAFPLALSAACAVCVVCPAAQAQTTFITTNRTIAGGNPLDGSYNIVQVGRNNIPALVPNVAADYVAGATVADKAYAYSNSVVTVYGGTIGTLANNAGMYALDDSDVRIQGGTINLLGIGAAGARATFSAGLIQNSSTGFAAVQVSNGATFTMTGGSVAANSSTGNGGLSNSAGTVTIQAGTISAVNGGAVGVSGSGALTISGGTISGSGVDRTRRGVRMISTSATASLTGGTINGGVYAEAANNVPALQANLSGTLSVNGGVFAATNADLGIYGGAYTATGSGANTGSFFALGTGNLNFYGTNLALSAPVAGSIFDVNTYTGNFYTFTSGTLRDGQSLVGLRLFDATSLGGNTAAVTGGFTLNTVTSAAAPEPSSFALIALSAVGVVVARRRKTC